MDLSGFDFNLLRVLDALLQEKSTVRAGQRIGLSQPAVSAALGRLRHALGDPLFVRQGQKLVPTDFALSIEHQVQEIVDRIARLLAHPSDFDPAKSIASFRLSGSDFFAEMLMPQLADTLSRIAPGMTVQLVDLVPDNYVGTLERREIDMALVPQMDFPEWTDHAPAFMSSFYAIARKGHPRLKRAGIKTGDVIPIDLFCDLDHVLFSPEGKLKAMGDAALAKVGRARRVVMTLPVFSGVANAVAGSDLISMVPCQLAVKLAPRIGLTVHPLPMPINEVRLCLVWHRRATVNRAHEWLRQTVLQVLSDLDNEHHTISSLIEI